MKRTGGQRVVDVLREEGVRKVFGVPGESYLNVMDALFDEEDMTYISARQEGGASFMAEGYAKATGEVGVCMATRGPGATNLSIGIHTAQQDSTPMVALIGQVERDFRDREAFQEVDFVGFFSHLCKWTVEINHADRVAELLHRAFHIARSGRPGPVLVSLPEDMLDDLVTVDSHKRFVVSRPRPCLEQVKEAVGMLEAAKRPILIAGGGVLSSEAEADLVNLAEKINIPVATAFRRFHAFPNDHANYAGSLGIGARHDLLSYIKESDLVLAIGTRFSQMTSGDYALLNETNKLIHVDIENETLGKVYTPTLAIQSDAKAFIQTLTKEVTNLPGNQAGVSALNEAYQAFSTPHPSDSTDYADMTSVVKDTLETVAQNSVITSDAGNFFSWVSRYFRFKRGATYIGPTSGAMGYGMPGAIGAKLAHPERTVVSFSGDGGYMMTMQEFETAVRYNIPIIAIVVNNNIYGTIRTHQENKFPDRVVGTDLSNPNYAELAKNFGGHGERVERSEDFKAALKRAIESNKPALIEVRTNPKILSANHQK